ncbi:MAG: M28 family peptidase, partial [Ginsengibacter sp.]
MKNYFLTAISILLFSGFTFAQESGWKYAESITQNDLRDHLKIIASAEMEGRETGTEGQRKAAAYIESQFKKLGLLAPKSLKGYQQYYPLLKDTLVPKKLKIGNQEYTYGTDYILQGTSDETKDLKANEIIFAGYGISDKNYSDYIGKNVKGKVVVVLSGEPEEDGKYLVSGTNKSSRWAFSSAMKVAAAMENGAAGVIFINTSWSAIPTQLSASSKSTRLYFPRNNDTKKLNLISMSPSSLKNIFSEAEANSILNSAKEKIALNNISISKKITTKLSFIKSTTKVMASNVIGYIEGTDLKDEYVFLTAHYDHLGKIGNVIYYGADDDGSGTVSVLEMAEAFAKAKAAGHGPRRTVVFMTVSGEEKGLWGSEYYSEHPVFPLEKTTVDLNTDMIGRLDPGRTYGDSTNYVYVVGDDKLSSDLNPISVSINDKYTKLELDYKFNDPKDPERIYFRSDHYNFARKGVPIIFYFDGIHKDYHKPTDTWDKIN